MSWRNFHRKIKLPCHILITSCLEVAGVSCEKGSSCVLWDELLSFKRIVDVSCIVVQMVSLETQKPNVEMILWCLKAWKVWPLRFYFNSTSSLGMMLRATWQNDQNHLPNAKPKQEKALPLNIFKSVRGHDIASQNTALFRRNYLKIDSNIFSVWSFQYENLNYLLFKRVVLLGSSIKAKSFQNLSNTNGRVESCGSRST